MLEKKCTTTYPRLFSFSELQ